MIKQLLKIIPVFLIVACTDPPEEINTQSVDEEIQQAVTDLYASIHYDGKEQPDWYQFRSLFMNDETF